MALLQYYAPTVIITVKTASAGPGLVCADSAAAAAAPPALSDLNWQMKASQLVDHGCFSQARKERLARVCFDDSRGLTFVKNYANRVSSSVNLDGQHAKQYYLSYGAAAAIFKWVDSELEVVVMHNSLKVSVFSPSSCLSIDATSAQNLELVQPLASASARDCKPGVGAKVGGVGSVFSVLKNTRTTGGTRLLRASLLQPLRAKATLKSRLDCIDELTVQESMFFALQRILQKFPKDVDRVAALFAFKSRKFVGVAAASSSSCRQSRSMGGKVSSLISAIIMLHDALALLPELGDSLRGAKSSLLQEVFSDVCSNPEAEALRAQICLVLSPDVLLGHGSAIAKRNPCLVVNAGVDGLLDVARHALDTTTEAIFALGKRYSDNLNLPGLKLPLSVSRGFYLSIPIADLQDGSRDLPPEFIQVTTSRKMINCSSQELISLNERRGDFFTQCCRQTERALEELCDVVRGSLGFLQALSESISLLDMMVNAFAHLANAADENAPYTRPEFNDDAKIVIEAGRHPVTERVTPGAAFVPNSITLSESASLVVLMGPNMSGKSTLLRQVALAAILAHMGCFVPAQAASFPILDRVLTRIGTGDDIESNSSTFMTEMREMAFIGQNATPRSLVLIDELGRGTATEDGFAIAFSSAEFLLQTKAFTIFATHMPRMAELARLYAEARVLHMEVEAESNYLRFKHVLKQGSIQFDHYGLQLAKTAGIPDSVIETATAITQKLDEKEMQKQQPENAQGGRSTSGSGSESPHLQQAKQYTDLKEDAQRDMWLMQQLTQLKQTANSLPIEQVLQSMECLREKYLAYNGETDLHSKVRRV
ncbi:hypothetical protein CBR_g547 [Chara braunii]|uniref:DNA mismatch repair proteins mutS family domain-containing protein n=1 Tax=Chara braunii TaxID=69332 RepID=A0A388KBK7_CHABU|nr:hypothetical protein CBR_g547 [Chara braunii]|eukprot:GBG67411.1 hypothetical protein CBR_g547 [Chara braunii]